MSWDIELDDQLLQDLYAWIDQIPLSRPKKRIEKDFADGVMIAELVKYYFPSWVDLHNYAAANSTQQKMINWGLLNRDCVDLMLNKTISKLHIDRVG
ncbi:unnamed protein product [Adineta steineri]|uniref:Calponin-homology (CH) domain-containing protein n=1 Tax=Adineta steineri TaxID=433720 RepID=A0A818WCL0_9BILA|nr:unnamed protein product [Adineta steineri]